jgi:hypothetical protein
LNAGYHRKRFKKVIIFNNSGLYIYLQIVAPAWLDTTTPPLKFYPGGICIENSMLSKILA